jgi:[acyl-carrier-protein] S-malonyltransferase
VVERDARAQRVADPFEIGEVLEVVQLLQPARPGAVARRQWPQAAQSSLTFQPSYRRAPDATSEGEAREPGRPHQDIRAPGERRYQRRPAWLLLSMPSRPGFLFPGQGSESVGMGSALHAADPQRLDRWLEHAEAASGLAIRHAVAEGPETRLASAEVAQPALLAISLAVAEAADEAGLHPGFVAGHGLGAYAAAVTAGVLDPRDALRLVAERGRLTAAADQQRTGAMAIVLGLPPAYVWQLCAWIRQRHRYVTVAHENSPLQAVVSGLGGAVDLVTERARREGAIVQRVPGRGAHHSLLMAHVQARLARLAATMIWRDASVPLISGTDGRSLSSGSEIRAALLAGETLPVRWAACMDGVLADGFRHFLEVGPGHLLTALVRQHSRDALAMAADGPVKLALFGERLAAATFREHALPLSERVAI